MDFVSPLIGFLMAMCHLASRVRGEDGEFLVTCLILTHAWSLASTKNTANWRGGGGNDTQNHRSTSVV